MTLEPERQTFVVVRRDGRLWILCQETGELVYTPPDFMRHKIGNRGSLETMAKEMTAGKRRIDAIMDFQKEHGLVRAIIEK